MNKKINWIGIVAVAASLAVGVIAGYMVSAPSTDNGNAGNSVATEMKKDEKQPATVWTCSMHPQVRQPKPGKCPICFMELIPARKSSSDAKTHSRPELELSPRAVQMARIQTETVRRKEVSVEIGLLGKIDFDESLISYITARMPGRVDKLYVDYTGISVQKGDHMVEYFSPELMVAQREFLFALKDYEEKLKNKSPSTGEAKDTLTSVLRKFDAWGLNQENIDKLKKTGEVSKYMTLYAPVSGIVIHKNAMEGKYFKTGDRLFTIANLSEVWVMLEAYETDIPWLRYGQEVHFTTKSCPGEVFKGRISFIDPTLDPQTRTVKVRVDAPNPSGKLKPEMFVNATVYAKVSQSGKVIDSSLSGKWICPMHPSVIEDEPGKCRICGMKLVKAESLGYSPVDEENRRPLVIPATAPLITGKRAVVYLAAKDKPGTYYGQEVVLGPRAGNYYVVKKGLKEGDQVVVNGNFEIDSALQIQAKPSMMSEEAPPVRDKEKAETEKTAAPVSASFKNKLDKVYLAYFGIHDALAADDLKKSQKDAETLMTSVSEMSHDGIAMDKMKAWHKLKSEILSSAKDISAAKSLTGARQAFSSLSADIYELCRGFGVSGKFPVYRFFCPMAFNNKGGYWLQNKTGVLNPYFGKTMLQCGEQIEEVAK